MRSPFKNAPRHLLGGLAIDGNQAFIVLAEPELPRRRPKLIDLFEARTADVAANVATITETYDRLGAEIHWRTALAGDVCLVESLPVPEDLAGAAAPERLEACLKSSTWTGHSGGDSSLKVSAQLDGERCHVAAIWEDQLDHRLAPFADGRARAVPESIALAELVRRTHPARTLTLALLCRDSSISFAILRNDMPELVRQVDISDSLTRLARRVASAAGELENNSETDCGWQPGVDSIDTPIYQKVALAEIREALTAYHEAGGHPSDIERVLIAGAAADRHDLLYAIPRALGDHVRVEEIEASRSITASDVELARMVCEHEPVLASVLALVASAARTDGIEFARQVETGRRTPRRPRELGRAATVAAVALVLFLGVVGGHYWLVSSQLAGEVAKRKLEQRRAAELQAITNERQAEAARVEETRQLLLAVEHLARRQQAPLALMTDVEARLPPAAGLYRLSLDREQVTVSGASELAADASSFALNLQQADGRFRDVVPSTDETTYVTAEHREERPLVRFTVRARYGPAAMDPAESGAVEK